MENIFSHTAPGRDRPEPGFAFMARLIRQVQRRLMMEYGKGEMRCPTHFCLGQEATPAALFACLKPSDVLSTHYRSHGYYLAKGGTVDALLAELMGKTTGCNGGVAGSMELADDAIGFSSSAIVGGSIAPALGAAFVSKFHGKQDSIGVAVFGDGAMDEGVVYEAMNLAELHDLPMLFICENNGTAADAPLPKRMGLPEIALRARAFMSNVSVFSTSYLPALVRNLTALVYHIRKGDGPAFVEVTVRRDAPHVGIGGLPIVAPPADPEIDAIIDAAFMKARAMPEPVMRDLLRINYAHTRRAGLPVIEFPGNFKPKQAEAVVRAF